MTATALALLVVFLGVCLGLSIGQRLGRDQSQADVDAHARFLGQSLLVAGVQPRQLREAGKAYDKLVGNHVRRMAV